MGSRLALVIAVAAAAGSLLMAWAVSVMINRPAEGIMSKEYAMKIVTDYLVSNDRYLEFMGNPEAKFGLIKYNATTDKGDQRFHWLNADPRDKTTLSYNRFAIFSPSVSNISSEPRNRYVWVVAYEGASCQPLYFVDASTGELLGIGGYEGFCGYCWHMYNQETYDSYIAMLTSS
jgi:hypothetical protein